MENTHDIIKSISPPKNSKVVKWLTYQVATNIDTWVGAERAATLFNKTNVNVILPALRGNIEFEVIVVLNDILPNLNTVSPSVSECLWHQNYLHIFHDHNSRLVTIMMIITTVQ